MNKFRVWCKNKKEWETDDVLMSSNGELFQQMKNGYIKRINNDTHVVEFSSGMCDINGVEIYSGDNVIEYHSEGQSFDVPFEVKFDLGFNISRTGRYSDGRFSYVYTNTYKIVGNIHDKED